MYYLKCKHCNHLNEVKSEYLVVCGLCNRKLVDNYKDWKVKHPEKSFEDFQREVCLTEEQVKKGDTIKPTGKRGNKKGLTICTFFCVASSIRFVKVSMRFIS